MKRVACCLMLLFIFFAYSNVLALDECTTSELKRLKELAKNVEFKYEYEIQVIDEKDHDIDVSYNIKIFNMHEDLSLYYTYANNPSRLKKISVRELEKLNFYESEKLDIYIYSYTNNLCTGELLKKENIKLPIYNVYYYFNKEKCNANPEFDYCREFININDKSFEEIDDLMESYIHDKDKNYDVDNIFNFNWYFFILIIVILIVIILIVYFGFFKKKNKEDI